MKMGWAIWNQIVSPYHFIHADLGRAESRITGQGKRLSCKLVQSHFLEGISSSWRPRGLLSTHCWVKPHRERQKYLCSVYFIFIHFIHKMRQGTKFLTCQKPIWTMNAVTDALRLHTATDSLWTGYRAFVLLIHSASVAVLFDIPKIPRGRAEYIPWPFLSLGIRKEPATVSKANNLIYLNLWMKLKEVHVMTRSSPLVEEKIVIMHSKVKSL